MHVKSSLVCMFTFKIIIILYCLSNYKVTKFLKAKTSLWSFVVSPHVDKIVYFYIESYSDG